MLQPACAQPAQESFARFCDANVNYTVIDSDDRVGRLLAALRRRRAFELAVDMETTSLTTLRSAIRLVQIGIRDDRGYEQWIVDAFTCDATALNVILASPRCRKLIHYSGFETNYAKIHLGTDIVNVFDAQAAWAAIKDHLAELDDDEAQQLIPGWDQFDNSLQGIAGHRLGLHIPKDERLSDWSSPALTDEQLRYAACDVAVPFDIADDARRAVAATGVDDAAVEARRQRSMSWCWRQDRLDSADELDCYEQVRSALAQLPSAPPQAELERKLRQWPVTLNNRRRLLDDNARLLRAAHAAHA